MAQRAEELLSRVEDRVTHDVLADLTERVRQLEATLRAMLGVEDLRSAASERAEQGEEEP